MSATGTVTYYDAKHRCGIIHDDLDDIDVAVSVRDLDASHLDHLTRHCHVSYDLVEDADGHIHARNLTLLQNPAMVSHQSSFARIRRAGRNSYY